MYLKKPVPGQPFRPDSQQMGALIDAAREVQQIKRTVKTAGQMQSDRDIIWIKNDTGEILERYGVVTLSSIDITPEDSQDTFESRIVFTGSVPASGDTIWAVALEPIADGEYGRAIASGVSQVMIDVVDEDDPKVTVADGDITQVQSGTDGEADILWKESGTGTKWGVIKFGIIGTMSTGTSSGGVCSCGTQYSRGSVVLTWSSVDVEFPTTYQTGWTDFPELTHIGSGVWESATATLDTCYGGIRSAKVQLTAIEPISMTATDFDGDVITFTAKIEVISVTNSCTGVDDDLANITAKFYCDNFNNLATSTFELVAYHNTGDYQFPCTVCVSPKVPTVSCDGVDIPEFLVVHVPSFNVGLCGGGGTYDTPTSFIAQINETTGDCVPFGHDCWQARAELSGACTVSLNYSAGGCSVSHASPVEVGFLFSTSAVLFSGLAGLLTGDASFTISASLAPTYPPNTDVEITLGV